MFAALDAATRALCFSAGSLILLIRSHSLEGIWVLITSTQLLYWASSSSRVGSPRRRLSSSG